MSRTLPALDHAPEIAQPKHIEKNMHGTEMNEHRRKKAPNFPMADFGQGHVRRDVAFTCQIGRDEQALDQIGLHSKIRKHEHEDTDYYQNKCKRAEAIPRQWPE